MYVKKIPMKILKDTCGCQIVYFSINCLIMNDYRCCFEQCISTLFDIFLNSLHSVNILKIGFKVCKTTFR